MYMLRNPKLYKRLQQVIDEVLNDPSVNEPCGLAKRVKLKLTRRCLLGPKGDDWPGRVSYDRSSEEDSSPGGLHQRSPAREQVISMGQEPLVGLGVDIPNLTDPPAAIF
jgi:hypothetical protein